MASSREWTFIITPYARKKLNELDGAVRKRILKRIDSIVQSGESPSFFLKPLAYELAGYYALRVGNYRLICEMRTLELIIIGVDVEHRRSIYGCH